ncbi:exonuclease SbcCD subunit D [Evansella cellulosilytica]|uniref:Nuclease SbcCD subunit D n=1 Tax=Evansella cellulosilytica (strain ATCC 21833 / DSM 2522 / FERM P-1141 / JCM 9156 / N-4) TaxID=649639 RepID=E6U0B2_EVAC2|nr:exonuclease SbcCD subunit D [Evansella cellulosilytica]ADU30228.1 nuclease SbcCD, D subunit [Evansella cellulosilytica DSM 2522]
MRLLHTADWHIGRTLEGRDRIGEHAQFFDELYDIVVREKVDAILMAGDVFDSVNPPAMGEELFYESVARLSDDGQLPIIVIAGNHDHPDRLQAARTLIKKQGVTILGYPTPKSLKIPIARSGEYFNIAALPYPSESRLKESFVIEGDELALREAYDERIHYIFEQLTKEFSPTEVNVAMSHLFVAGGNSTESERPIEVGGAYTIRATHLPSNVQYTALGHLHRPQNIKRSPKIARYSGSPLAFSFSETGYTKSVTIVDIIAGEDPVIEEIPLSSGKPLVRWNATKGLEQVFNWMDEGRDRNAWIDLEVHLENAPSMEQIHQMKKEYPGLINIRPVFPESMHLVNQPSMKHMPIQELFENFYSRQTGGAIPEKELISLFLELVNEEGDSK